MVSCAQLLAEKNSNARIQSWKHGDHARVAAAVSQRLGLAIDTQALPCGKFVRADGGCQWAGGPGFAGLGSGPAPIGD